MNEDLILTNTYDCESDNRFLRSYGSNSNSNRSNNNGVNNNIEEVDGFDIENERDLKLKRKLRRTTITIDSTNRVKNPQISKKLVGRLPINPFKTQIGSNLIKVWCPYEEILDINGNGTGKLKYIQYQDIDIGRKQLIFSNLKKDISEDKINGYNYYKIGIQRKYIEFDNDDIVNKIYLIKEIGYKVPLQVLPGYEYAENKKYKSDYFVISLNEKINTTQIIKGEFGGGEVILNEVSSFINGYENSSHYKIDLGREYSNVYMVKLRSIILPNTAYTINSREEKSNIGNFNVKTKVNNKLKWVNKLDRTDIYNLSLYSDKIFSTSINFNNLVKNSNKIQEQSTNQKNYSDEFIEKLTADKDMSKCSEERKLRSINMREVYSNITSLDNKNSDYYSEKCLHTDGCENELIETFDNTITSNKGKYWLPNMYHNLTKTLIYFIFESITKPYYTNDQYKNSVFFNINKDNIDNLSLDQKKIYNRNIKKLLRNNPWHYYYLNSLVNKGTNNLKNNDRRTINNINNNNNLLDFENTDDLSKNFKYLEDLDIPKYMGYHIFESILEDGQQESKLNEELIENYNESRKYIYPSNYHVTDKLLAPTLVPNIDTNILNLKNQVRYPIYEVSLTDGKYSTKSFIRELQNKLSKTFKKTYDGEEKIFEKQNFSLDKLDFQPIFNVNVNKNLNFIDVRQYTPITKYIDTQTYNPNLIYYNEGIPLLAMRLFGHSLNTGDKILVTGANDTDNIEEESINGEHIIKVAPSFKMNMRLIYPLPELAYLDQNKYFNEKIGKEFELEDKTSEFKLKRDLRKFLLKPDDLISNIPTSNLWYGGNWEKEHPLHESQGSMKNFDNKPIIWEGYSYDYSENGNNTIGNATHSKRELYPIKYISNDSYKTNLTFSWNNPYMDSQESNMKLIKGNKVQAKRNDDYVSGIVDKVNDNDSYNIKYDDTLIIATLNRDEIRLDMELFGNTKFEFESSENTIINTNKPNLEENYPRSWANVNCYNRVTKPYELERYYGKFKTNIPYQFGIYYSGSNSYQIKNFVGTVGGFKELEPRSQKDLNEGSLIMSVKNALMSAPNNRQFTTVQSEVSDTLRTNYNYFGSKMINSVNNRIMYPEDNTNFKKNNSILAKGIECSMLLNETFVKLSDIKNITNTTTIGRVTQINNDNRVNDMGNFEIYFDLITEIELGNFNIGDVIIGLDSNCIGMIVPESWEYCSLIEEEVINKGFGTYILEKYRNLGSINKMISKATNTFMYKDKLDINLKEWKKIYDPSQQNSEDLNKFLKKYDNWSIQESPNSSQYIYYSIEPIFPSKSRISGVKTTDLVISKPVEFKFIFDENTSPIDRLNIPIEQSFNFSQNNLKKFNEININRSYLLGLNNNTLQDYLVIETFEKMNFKKNDRIYIKNHKIINRNINDNKVYNLTIESVEPFRNYIQFIQNNYYNIINFDLNEITMYNSDTREIDIPSDNTSDIEKIKRNKYSHFEDNISPVPFSNINLIWDYNVNKIKYCLGKDKNVSTSYSIDNELHDKFKTNSTDTMICISNPIENYHLPLNVGDIVSQYYNEVDPKIVACGTIKNFISSGIGKKIINIEIENVSGTFIGNTEVSNLKLFLDIKRPNKKFVKLKFSIGDLSSSENARIKVNDRIIQGTSSAIFLKNEGSYLILETNVSSIFTQGINSPPIYIERLNPINDYPEKSKIPYQEIFPKITFIEVIIDPFIDNKKYDVIKVINPNINELDVDGFEQNTIVTKDDNNNPWIENKNLSSDFQKVYSKSIYYSGKNSNNNLNNLNLVKRGPFELFNNDNIMHFGIRERLINWFFENPFNWNNNNLEKVLEFKNKYEPSIENKNIIVKLIVSPLDSYGMNFLKNGCPSFFKRAGNLSELAYKGAKVIPFKERPREGGYTDVSGTNTTVNRNVNTILPFISGMGVYINNPFLEKYTTLESIEKFNKGETDTQYTVKLIDPYWDYERNEYIGELYSLNTFSNNRSNANNQYVVGWKSTHQEDNGKWLGNYKNLERLEKTDTAEPQLHNYLVNDPLEAVYKRPVSGLIGYVLDTTIENIEDYINNYDIKSYTLDVSTITRQENTTIFEEEPDGSQKITISNSTKTENLIGTPSLDCSTYTNPPKNDVSQRSYEFTSTGKYVDFKTTLNNRNQYDLNNDGNQDILGITDTHKSIFSLNSYYDTELENYTYDSNIEQYADAYLIKILKKYREDNCAINQNQDDTDPYRLTDWESPEKPYKFAFTRQRWWVEKQLCIPKNTNSNELKYPDNSLHDNISLFTWKNVKPIYNDKAKIYIKQSLLYINDTRYQHHRGEYVSNSYLNDNNPNYRGVMKVEIITEFDGSYGLDSDYRSLRGITKNSIGGNGAEFIISKNFYNKFPDISISKPGTGYDVGDIIDIIVHPYSSEILKNKAFYVCAISITDDKSPYNEFDPINFYTGDSILIEEIASGNNIYPAVKGIIPFDQSINQISGKLIIKMLTSTTIDKNLRGIFKWTKINSRHGSDTANLSLSIGATLNVNVVKEFNNIENNPDNNFYPIQNLQLLVKEVIVSNSLIGPSRLICNTSEWNKRGICEGYINTFNDNTIRNNDIKEIIITSGGGKYSPFLLKTIKKQSIKFISYSFNDCTNFKKIKVGNNNPINIIQKTNAGKIIAHGQVLVGNALTKPNSLLKDSIKNFEFEGIDYNIDRNELLIELDKITLTLDKSYPGEITDSILVKNSENIIIGNIIDNNLLTNEIVVKIASEFTSNIKNDDIITIGDNQINYTILNIQNQFILNVSVINGLFIDDEDSSIYFEYYDYEKDENEENKLVKHTSTNNQIYISKFSIINDNNLYTSTIDPNFSKNFKFVFSPQPQIQKISGIFYPKLPNNNSINGNWLNRSQWWDGSLPDPQEWGVLDNFIIKFNESRIYKKNDVIIQKDNSSNIIASGSVKINYTETTKIEINIIFGEFVENDHKIYLNNIELIDYKIESLSKRNNPKGLYNPSIQYKEEVRKIIPDFEYLHPDIQFNELCIDSTIPTSWTLNDNSLNPKNNIVLGAHNGDFKASVNLVDFAPTYTIYLLVNKDSILFKEDNWIESSNSLNYNNMSYLTRGTDIFFNIDKLKELNTVNNDECNQYDTDIETIGSDSNTLGSYNWRNRQAVATIFQGVLEKNDLSLIDTYEGTETDINAYYNIPFVPPQNTQTTFSNTLGRDNIIYKEEPIINSNYKPGSLDSKVVNTYKKIYIHPKPSKIEDNASLKYNQATDLITVNDYNNIYYDLNVSGDEEYRTDPSDNILKSRAEFVHQYNSADTEDEEYRRDPIDNKFKNQTEFISLYPDDGTQKWDDAEDSNVSTTIGHIKWFNAEFQEIVFRIDKNDQKLKTYDEFISLYNEKAGEEWDSSVEEKKTINTTVVKDLFNNYQKINRIILGKKYIKPIFLVSGHLDYFYSFYLQNKSILNLSKAYDNISKDSINNIQNIMETKEFNISEDTKYNNFNDLNKKTNNNSKLNSRSNVVNFENLDFLPLNSSTNIFVYNHTKQVSKYNDFSNIVVGDSSSIANCTNLQTTTSFNNFEKNFIKENVGINDGAYGVLCSLWSGGINNTILFNKYKPGRAVLTDIEFNNKVEKGSFNKGNIRVKIKKTPIIGNNSKNYKNNFDIDTQNEFVGYIKYDNTGNFNKRGTNKLKIEYAYSNPIISPLNLMFEENDLLFISSNLHSNDDNGNYKSTNIKCCLNNSEIGIVKKKCDLSGDNKDCIEVELKNELINDHNPDNDSINNGRELVIARYKYGEIYEEGIHTKNLFEDYSDISNNNRFIWNSDDHYIHYTDGGYKSYYDPIQYPYLVKIKRYIDSQNESSIDSQNESSIDYSLDKYLAVGDTICFDWGTQRYIDYINTDERLPPFDIVPTECIDTNNNTVCDSYKKEMKGDLRLMYTQQFNRILKKSLVNKDSQGEYIMIMLEKRPYIHYSANTPFMILKQTHRNSVHSNNNKQNNINFNSISTQPFTYNNELYTKVFYQGDKPITTTFNCYNWKFNQKYLSFNEIDKKYRYEYKHRLYPNMENFDADSDLFSYKKYENDDIQNDLKAGCKMFNNNLKKNIHIDSMKGIDIPFIPIPNITNKSYYDNLKRHTNDNFVIETITTGPIKDINLETEPIVIEDFNNLVENKHVLPILGQNYNYSELFEKYNNTNSIESSEILDQLLENYKTGKNNIFWEDYVDTKYIKNNKFENINFRNQMLYTYEDVFNSEYFYVFLESILYDEIYQYSNTSFDNLSENLYNLLDKADIKQYDYTPVLYNYVIVKGMYIGYGGYISEKNIDETNIINNSDGWKVISVINQNSPTQPNRIIIDVDKSLLNFNIDESNIYKNKIFSKFNNSLQKLPTGVFNYDILLDNLQTDIFNNTREIGNSGTIFMQKLSAPLNLIGNNYIYLCIPEFEGQMETSSTKIINNAFAKILLPGESNQTLYNTFTSGTKIFYQETLNTLDSIEVCFLTDDKFLFDFNGLEHSFSIEIYEIVDYV